ncbi:MULTISPECIES: alanine--glyoxylate aminotransferase family protein [unclassified Brevibacterium]|uniref:alanine--glyoxylate aminotransferase family protein n=1 Tax=unclassified Brevibacterium TaxID=2614124 RepID=UPI001BAABBCD|nr:MULTISPECIES: alanine--glyoxylate aminotransferase family protein [unclassified Brevibacterium]QUL79790.1 alanine--glyoxylate aminotransferase family protein [Brevibacterium sp. SMBL_HHYL_HB1]
MTLPHEDVDPDGLLEYSVVFTDRSLNHMSKKFVSVMQDINRILRSAYDAEAAAIVPGGGSYAMESVARQIATGKKVLIVRNGLFSFRWSQILDAGDIAAETTVLQASADSDVHQSTWSPAPITEVVAAIEREKPDVVFAPHVETASGMLLPDDYVKAVSEAVHAVGGLFVLDCIASGAVWASMTDLGVDILISAPQKGWSGSPCAGYVMLGQAARKAVEGSTSSSFSMDLKKWLSIADEYEAGRSPYHATMPTDALTHNVELMRETEERGYDKLESAQKELGERVRAVFAERGLPSVASPEFASPSVVVVHTDNPQLANGASFKEAGVQIAAGVPLQCGEPEDFSTFRIGLFGLDKLGDIDGTIARLESALNSIGVTAQA